MTRRSSRSIYEARIHRVLRYIDANIAGNLDLGTLASVASFSPHHFHRLFAAWTGERLGEYLRRRRLEIGARRLAAQPALRVLDVALSVGFGSGEAFARAFRARFGAAPSAWRRTKNRNAGQANSNLDQARPGTRQQYRAVVQDSLKRPMEVRMETRSPVSVAYLRHEGPYGDPVGRFWRGVFYPWMAANSLVGSACYGIGYDAPGMSEPGKFRYDACVEVPDNVPLAGGALRSVIPGGRYALSDFEGTLAELGERWSALFREWLPDSGLQLDERPCFEYYPPDAPFDEASGRFACTMYVPVAPLLGVGVRA